jgi:hypothetical protein
LKRPRISRAEVLELRPRDRVVVYAHTRVSVDEACDLRLHLADVLNIDDRRVLVVHGATLAVLREGEPPPPPVILSAGSP